MRKRISKSARSLLSFVLAVAMVAGMSGTSAFAEEQYTESTKYQTILVKQQVNGTADTAFSYHICQVIEAVYPIEDIADDILKEDIGADLSYTIYDSETDEEIGSGTTDEDGMFSLQDGEYASFTLPADTDWYIAQDSPDSCPLLDVAADGEDTFVVQDIYGVVQYGQLGDDALAADRQKLQEAYDEAIALDENEYTPESWAPFAKALVQAKDVLENENATLEEIEQALQDLQEARDGLVKAELVPPTVSISTGLAENTKVYDGEGVTLTAVASDLSTGAEASYQWYKDGEAVDGATESTYTVPGNVSDSGTYRCVVTVKYGGRETTAQGEVALTIEKTAQDLSFETASVAKYIYDEPFTHALSEQDVVGTLTYTTSDESVAAVDPSTGEVAIRGIGEATITATALGDENHETAAASYVLVVNEDEVEWRIDASSGALTWDEEKGEYVDDLTYDGNPIEIAIGISLTAQEQEQVQAVRLQWYRYDPETQAFDAIDGATGKTYTLEDDAVNAGDHIYLCEVDVTYKNGNAHTVYSPIEIRIAKLAQSISYGQPELEKDVREAPFTNDLTIEALSPEDGAGITYTSSEETIAAVDPATGEVTLLAVGEATITAAALETTNYEAASASYTLTVNPHEHVWGEVTWAWSEDHTDATASRTCTLCGDTQTADAVKITHTTTATATKPGQTTYTATAIFEDGTEVTGTETVDTDAIDPEGYITVLYNGEETRIANTEIDAAIEAADEQTFTYTSKDTENTITKHFVLLSDLTGNEDFCCYTVTASDGYVTTGLPADTYLYWRDDEACYRTAVNGGTGSQWIDSPATVELLPHTWGEEVTWAWSEDYSEATAGRICTVCGGTQTADADKITHTTTATATKPGETTYTATAIFEDGTEVTGIETVDTDAIDPEGYITVLYNGEETRIANTEIDAAIEAAEEQTFTYTSKDKENTVTKQFVLLSDLTGIEDFCCYNVTAGDGYVTTGLPADTYLYWRDDTACYRTAVDGGTGSQWADDPDTIDVIAQHTWSVRWEWSDGYSSATAYGTCDVCGLTETVEASISGVTREPTQKEDGETVYTAEAVFSDGQVETDSRTEILPAYDRERAFAVYCRTDNSLTFYVDNPAPSVGDTYRGKVVSELYLDVDSLAAADANKTPWYSRRESIQSVVIDASFASVQPISLDYWFYYFSNAAFSGLEYIDTSEVTGLAHTFHNCAGLTTARVSEWDTANVTNMQSAFHNCSGLTTLDLSGWDTSNVTDMQSMFNGCASLTDAGDLSTWDTAAVTNMSDMFSGCLELTDMDVADWDTAAVTSMSYMFQNSAALTSLDLEQWDTTEVTAMTSMFYGCTSLTDTGDLSEWNTENVVHMGSMFRDCASLTSVGDLSNWDTAGVTNMAQMFYGCASLAGVGNLSGWNTSDVTAINSMFYGCTSLTGLGASGWDTAGVTDMTGVFSGCSSLAGLDLSGWDTSAVTNMSSMFQGCLSLATLSVAEWDTAAVTNMNAVFCDCVSLESLDLSGWDTNNLSSSSSYYRDFATGCSSLEWVQIGENTDIFTRGQLVDQQAWYDSPENGRLVSSDYLRDVTGPGQYWSYTVRDETLTVSYAVKIWGIYADTYSQDGGATREWAGLTFGPATGGSYLDNYEAHLTEEAYEADDDAYCIHWMTWDEIIEQSAKDPTVFENCLDNGCTKAVELEPNNTLFNSITVDSAAMHDYAGDGVGTLYYLLNGTGSANAFGANWNYSRDGYSATDPANIYAKSRIRVTLNGDASDAELKYASAGGADLCDADNCLLSCFPEALREAIVPRTVRASDSAYDSTTYDKLWLFANSELGIANTSDNGVDYGVSNASGDRIAYEYTGTDAAASGAHYYWTRTRYLVSSAGSANNDYQAYYINTLGNYGYTTVTGAQGLSPCFCLAGPAGWSVDKTALQEEYDKDSTLSEEDYTAGSWETFAKALAAAKEVIDDPVATTQDVAASLEALQTARQGLVATAAMTPWTTVRYAVKIWGIEADTYSTDEGRTNYLAGLTFGPATGDSANEDGSGYINAYRAHLTKEEYDPENGKYCIHWMTWDEILAQNKKDPTVFEDCKENGCTKAVELTTNETLFNETVVDNALAQEYIGDGISTLYHLLNYASPNYVARWNYAYAGYSESDPANLYSKSRVRVTLTGDDSDAELQYASSGDGSDLCDEANCLLSCFPENLRKALVPRATVNAGNPSTDSSAGDKTTYDKLFLFSAKEAGITNNGDDAGGSDYGAIADSAARVGYEFGSTAADSPSVLGWWTRSRSALTSSSTSRYRRAFYVSANGTASESDVSEGYGISPGFSLPGPEGQPTVTDVTITSDLADNTKVYDGVGFSLAASATLFPDTSELSYQWYKVAEDGTDVPIDGATDRECVFDGNVADSGTYKCVVTVTNDGMTDTAKGAIDITIEKAAQDISYATKTVNRTVGDAPFTTPLTETTVSTEEGAGITYISSDTSVATVDASTGEVTIQATGKVTITAMAAATANYASATASYTISITEEPLDTVNYAVKLWGINRDVDEEGNVLGLTFGPATGTSYISGYKAHLTEAAYEADDDAYCIHWMTWDEIIEQSRKNPTVFADCLENGCTKAVELTPNDTLFDMPTVENAVAQNYTGDGVSTLYYLINVVYRCWNYSSTGATSGDCANVYSRSRIRATLTGDSADAQEWVQDGHNDYYRIRSLLTEEDCLFSCFPESLQEAIVPRTTQNTGNPSSGTSQNDKTTYDKLFLFSLTEIGSSDEQYDDGGGSDYGVNSSASDRIVYEFNGKGAADASAQQWWTRARISSSNNQVYYMNDSGSCVRSSAMDDITSTACGISPGFCIR